jgi:hypothetical protein
VIVTFFSSLSLIQSFLNQKCLSQEVFFLTLLTHQEDNKEREKSQDEEDCDDDEGKLPSVMMRLSLSEKSKAGLCSSLVYHDDE